MALLGAITTWVFGALSSIATALISLLKVIYDIFIDIYRFVRDIFPAGHTNSTGILGVGLLFLTLILIFIGMTL